MTDARLPRPQIAFAHLIETLFKNAIQLDAYHGSDLQALADAVIALELKPIPWKVYMLITDDGITVQSHLQGEPDAAISGFISDWAALNAIIEVPTAIDDARLNRFTFDGNLELAKGVLHAIQAMELDWEEKLSAYTGDLVAHQVAQKVRQWHGYKTSTGRQFIEMFEEFLKHEVQLAPSRTQVHNWQNSVKDLEQQTEKLLERVAKLDHQ